MSSTWVAMHGVGSRQDLPLPFELVVAGGVLTLLITFVVALRAWHQPKWAEPAGRPLPRLTAILDHPALRWTARLLVLAVVAVAILALVAGPDRVSNPFPGFLFVWVWVGLVPVSLLAGLAWRDVSAVRTLVFWRGAHAPGQHRPLSVGLYPAAAALFAFTWLELVQPDRATTAVLKWWALAFGLWALGGAVVWGGRWLASAEPFEVFGSTVARLSPWQRRDGVLEWTNPLRQVSSWSAPRGLWAVGAVLLGGTAFDSLSGGVWWVRSTQSSAQPPWLWGTLGLVGCILVVTLTFGAAVLWLRRFSDDNSPSRGQVMDSMARSLVPIVAAYALAHYATLLVIEGQRVAINLSDPLGRHQNWFGTAELGVNGAIFDYATAVSWAQVAFIVGGHVLGVAAAHDIALRLVPRARQLAAQLPLLVVMVGYTCAGLLLLFA